jgi:hypothetical protein
MFHHEHTHSNPRRRKPDPDAMGDDSRGRALKCHQRMPVCLAATYMRETMLNANIGIPQSLCHWCIVNLGQAPDKKVSYRCAHGATSSTVSMQPPRPTTERTSHARSGKEETCEHAGRAVWAMDKVLDGASGESRDNSCKADL